MKKYGGFGRNNAGINLMWNNATKMKHEVKSRIKKNVNNICMQGNTDLCFMQYIVGNCATHITKAIQKLIRKTEMVI